MVKKLEMVRSKSIIRLDIRVSRLDIRMSNLKVGVGHTYVQAIMKPIGLDIRMFVHPTDEDSCENSCWRIFL